MIESYLERFEAFSRNGGADAPQWARSLRMSGIARFGELGFPTTRNEDWHFTSVAPIADREFAPLTSGRAPWRSSEELALELEAKGYDWLLEEAVA